MKAVRPVCVAAHSFSRGVPRRDLRLSPDHAVYVDGVLIPIKYLINGISIVQTRINSVQYFHLELDRHDVILAEGLPAESYLDTGDRFSFDNAGGVMTLHPEWRRPDVMIMWEALGFAPLRIAGPEIVKLRRRLAARANRLRAAA